MKRQKMGALLAFIQTPFRILIVIPPSIFFITWPLEYFFGDATWPAVVCLIVVVVGSEVLKVLSVTSWYRRIVRLRNPRLQPIAEETGSG